MADRFKISRVSYDVNSDSSKSDSRHFKEKGSISIIGDIASRISLNNAKNSEIAKYSESFDSVPTNPERRRSSLRFFSNLLRTNTIPQQKERKFSLAQLTQYV